MGWMSYVTPIHSSFLFSPPILFFPNSFAQKLKSFSCETHLAAWAAVKFAIVRDPVLALANLTFDVLLTTYAVGHITIQNAIALSA
jgi:hypothetical protein